MLPFSEYTNGWIIYALAVIGLLFIFWRIVRHIAWRHVRQPLFLSAAVFLLTPTIGNDGYWAPAWVIGSLELLFSGVEAAKPLFMLLLIVLLVVLVLYTAAYIGFYFYRKKQLTQPAKKTNARVANAVAH